MLDFDIVVVRHPSGRFSSPGEGMPCDRPFSYSGLSINATLTGRKCRFATRDGNGPFRSTADAG